MFFLLKFDLDKNGYIMIFEIGEVMKVFGESIFGYKIWDIIKEVDINENGIVEFIEFLEVGDNFLLNIGSGSLSMCIWLLWNIKVCFIFWSVIFVINVLMGWE